MDWTAKEEMGFECWMSIPHTAEEDEDHVRRMW